MNTKKSNMVCKDNFICSAVALDAIEYISQDIQLEYFDKFNEHNNNLEIVLDFARNRARMNAIVTLLGEIRAEFNKNGITAYQN
jgi:hypothetical protein